MLRTGIKFGLFVVLCLGMTWLLYTTIGNKQSGGHYTLHATFDDVSGLLRDDNVKVAGVAVGKVTVIKVDSGRADVTFTVKNSVRLPKDTTSASIRWRNLIGQRYLYLEPNGLLTDGDTVLADDDTVADTRSVVDLGELFNDLGPIVAAIDPTEVNRFLNTVQAAITGNEAEISKALDDLTVVVESLASRDEAIARLIKNSDTVAAVLANRNEQIKTMLDNLVKISQTFNDNTDVLDQSVVELGEFNHDLAFLLQNNRTQLDRSIGNLNDLTDVVRANLGPIETTLKRLPDLGRGVFNTSSNGEWLNETILCAATAPPPCSTPIVPGVSGQSAGSATSLNSQPRPEGAEALRSLWRSWR